MKAQEINWLFHGDVIVILNAKPDVIQWGEHSNHAHRLHGDGFTILETPERVRYLRLLKETPLKHEEHHEIKLPPGDHEIRIIREVGWFDDVVAPVVD